MLTEKEKEQISNLPRNFNKVPEDSNYNYRASRRLDISRVWSKRLFKMSIGLNIASILLVLSSFIISYMKPAPEFYASTPSGKIYHLKKIQ